MVSLGLTTRALPNRSFAAACRHLFRHLRHPWELRRNPLVGAYFARELTGAARARSDEVVAGAIRAAIGRCADACLHKDRLDGDENALRRYAIAVEGDLAGTPRNALAAALGVSERHYTRLQHAVRERIAMLLPSEMRSTQNAWTQGVALSPSPLHRVAVLAATGSTDEAAERLQAIVGQSGDDRLVASALCLRALLRQRYAGDVAGAIDSLAASKSVVEKLAAEDPARAMLEAEIALAWVEIDVSGGRFDRATQSATAIAQTLQPVDEATRWLKLRALSWAAYGEFVQGRRDRSLSFLSTLVSGIGEAKTAPAPDRVELSLNAAIVLAELGRFSESSRMLVEGWIVARQNALDLEIVRLDLMDAMIALDCGDVAKAIRRLSGICEHSRLVSPALRAQAHAYLARAQMRAPHPRPNDILKNVKHVLDLTPNEYAAWTDAKIAESFARLTLHDVAGAESAARAADEAAVTMGHRLYRGSTLRELARVAHVQGRRRDAKRMILSAVEASYGVGKPQQAAEALDLAAQILKQPNYRTEASVLRNAIALP